ncbi:MAG: hypothetical protein HIU91_05845 [Acidobacteria bacterium]|nr:hypothetical protein [Acidobacteriota bacterium]
MTTLELDEIANQRMSDPNVLGRFVCHLRSNDRLAQRHHDDQNLSVAWQDAEDFWRCTIFADGNPAHRVAQVDLHENNTVRADLFEPGRITVSPEEGILCLTRYKPR